MVRYNLVVPATGFLAFLDVFGGRGEKKVIPVFSLPVMFFFSDESSSHNFRALDVWEEAFVPVFLACMCCLPGHCVLLTNANTISGKK